MRYHNTTIYSFFFSLSLSLTLLPYFPSRSPDQSPPSIFHRFAHRHHIVLLRISVFVFFSLFLSSSLSFLYAERSKKNPTLSPRPIDAYDFHRRHDQAAHLSFCFFLLNVYFIAYFVTSLCLSGCATHDFTVFIIDLHLNHIHKSSAEKKVFVLYVFFLPLSLSLSFSSLLTHLLKKLRA